MQRLRLVPHLAVVPVPNIKCQHASLLVILEAGATCAIPSLMTLQALQGLGSW